MEIVGKSSFLWWSFLLLWVGFILLNWLTVLEERFFLVCFVLSFLLFFLFFPSKKNPSTAGKQKTTSWAVKSLLQHIYWSFCWTHVLFWFKPMLGCTVVFPSLYQFWRQGHVGQKDHSTRAATSILLLFEQHWACPEVKELGLGSGTAHFQPHHQSYVSHSHPSDYCCWSLAGLFPVALFKTVFSSTAYAAPGMVVKVWIEWEHLILPLTILLICWWEEINNMQASPNHMLLTNNA